MYLPQYNLSLWIKNLNPMPVKPWGSVKVIVLKVTSEPAVAGSLRSRSGY